MRRKMQPVNKYNLKLKDEYTQYESRTRLNTTLRDSIHKDITELSILTNQPISKILDVLLLEVFSSEENVQNLVDKVRKY